VGTFQKGDASSGDLLSAALTALSACGVRISAAGWKDSGLVLNVTADRQGSLDHVLDGLVDGPPLVLGSSNRWSWHKLEPDDERSLNMLQFQQVGHYTTCIVLVCYVPLLQRGVTIPRSTSTISVGTHPRTVHFSVQASAYLTICPVS
jgi:hypothetical protein